MNHRLSISFAAFALTATLFWASSLQAGGKSQGTILQAGSATITVAEKKKTEHEFVIPNDVKIIRDGKSCKIGDLKKGDRVEVTFDTRNTKKVALTIDAISQAANDRVHEGTVVQAADDVLTIADAKENTEHEFQVVSGAKLFRDGKPCKVADLKKGDRVIVTFETKDRKKLAQAIDAVSSGAVARTYEGTIVQAASGTLTILDQKTEREFAIPADVKVSRDGKACKVADLKQGEKVEVKFEATGDGKTILAKSIEVRSRK